MLVLATLFWAGNFIVGKFASFTNIPPMTLVFFRWLLVWIILLPFTYKEIIKFKSVILDNLPLLFFLALTSVGLFNSFTYLSLVHTQVINASLFNTAIPAIIILLCFLFKVEQTNKYQILGLIISVCGILAIITRLKLDILFSLNFNRDRSSVMVCSHSFTKFLISSSLVEFSEHQFVCCRGISITLLVFWLCS